MQKVLVKLSTQVGINLNWLLTGDRNMYFVDDRESGEYAYIPVYDVEVSAGHGSTAYGVSEPESRLAFRKDWLTSRGLKSLFLHAVIARDDSMEPTIGNKDTLLVDTARSAPRDGHIYVIRFGDTLWVKRVQQQPDNSLLLISDNHTYPPMQLRLEDHPDIEIIGRVVNVSKELN
ncbi:S24 family peptidase [Neisseria zalophi]|uniref:S24 family peptidase n=1 Tax=Neisseria zalophi TaxID=640030 RepID=UPI001CD9F67A|nr:helix-turn-helix transcriptional regulator [Neisseria zalophi]